MTAFENLAKLPEKCASILKATGQPIIIVRGEAGYNPVSVALKVDEWNEKRGVTKAQRLAMEYGSCFGWEIPAANPDTWLDV